MKKILILIALLWSTIGFSQSQLPTTGSPNGLNRTLGGHKVDSVQIIPVRDTVQWLSTWGNLTIRPQDGNLYYRSNGFWKAAWHNAPVDTNFIRNQGDYKQVADFRISGTGYASSFIAWQEIFQTGYAGLTPGGSNYSGALIIAGPTGTDGFIGEKSGKMYYSADTGQHEFAINSVTKVKFTNAGIEVAGTIKQGSVTNQLIKADGNGVLIAALAGIDYVTVSQLMDSLATIDLNSVTFTGNATKTLRLTKGNGAWIEGTFTDNDNQTLSLNNDVLSISGGNNITLPYLSNSLTAGNQSFTGTATNSVTLTAMPSSAVPVLVTMNTAILDPTDWTRTGSTINLSFTTSVTDIITIYYTQ